MFKLPNILIVGTVPYNPESQSRATWSYFGSWEISRENAAQIFSDSRKPVHGYCKTFFQITDGMLLNKLFHHCKKDVGIIYNDVDIEFENFGSCPGKPKKSLANVIKSRKTAAFHLLRGLLWREKNWRSQSLLRWADSFRPDVIYCAFSNDFFILNLSLFFAKRYQIPIISQIGDDYYFNGHFSLSPFYWIYRLKYKKLVRKILSYPGSVLYTSKKIKDLYQKICSLPSDVLYISSDVPKASLWMSATPPNNLTYIGNTSLGRYKPIIEIGEVLSSLFPNVFVDVFSPETDPRIVDLLKKSPGIHFHGSISYNEVKKQLSKSATLLVTESFDKKDLVGTAFSLSTKIADSLSSGVPIFAYGPLSAGAMLYLSENQTACCCFQKKDLPASLKRCLLDQAFREELSKKEISVADMNHRQNVNSQKFLSLVIGTVDLENFQ